MTNPAMDAVKAVYPDAKCIFVTHNFSYYITSAKGTRGVGGRLSEYMWSIEDAWQSAESRLVPAPEVGESKVFDQKLHDECIKCRCKSEGRFPCDTCQRAWHQAWDLVEGKITKAAPPVAEVVGPIKGQLQCQVCGCDIDFDDFCNRCRKTLDVERASKWLDVNGFMGGGLMKRGIAELLHDYSLTVAAPPPLTEGDRSASESILERLEDEEYKPWPKWIEAVSRFEDMTVTGKLSLFRQQDGDVIVEVIREEFGFQRACVEFCIPMTGGGQSEHTHRALCELMVAMEKDNEERSQSRRTEAKLTASPDLEVEGDK